MDNAPANDRCQRCGIEKIPPNAEDCYCAFCRAIVNKQTEDASKLIDQVNHPEHYTSHPSGIECIEISKHMNFCLGNALKYVWRAGLKEPSKKEEDLRKAIWYIEEELGDHREEEG